MVHAMLMLHDGPAARLRAPCLCLSRMYLAWCTPQQSFFCSLQPYVGREGSASSRAMAALAASSILRNVAAVPANVQVGGCVIVCW